jgi:hypothetical protein
MEVFKLRRKHGATRAAISTSLNASACFLRGSYSRKTLNQKCTIPGWLVAQQTTLCAVAPNIFTSSVWNLLHVVRLMPEFWDGPSRFLENLWALTFNSVPIPTTILLTVILPPCFHDGCKPANGPNCGKILKTDSTVKNVWNLMGIKLSFLRNKHSFIIMRSLLTP